MSQSFEIDIHNLDTECIEHPQAVYEYHQVLADAQAALRKAETVYSEWKNKIDKNIRDRPEKYSIVKLTEGAVESARKSIQKYKELRTAIDEAQSDVENAWSSVHAIRAKGERLADLVKLHGQDYFADVPVTKKGVEEVTKTKTRRKGGVRK